MTRRLLNLLAVLSALLCVATAVSWALSYRTGPAGFEEFPNANLSVAHARGAVQLVVPTGQHAVSGPEVIPLPKKVMGPGDASTWSIRGKITMRSPDGTARQMVDTDLNEKATSRSFRATRMDEAMKGTRVGGIEWRAGRTSVGPVDTSATPMPSGTLR